MPNNSLCEFIQLQYQCLGKSAAGKSSAELSNVPYRPDQMTLGIRQLAGLVPCDLLLTRSNLKVADKKNPDSLLGFNLPPRVQ
jgi:hypothetical protein